MPNIDNRCVRSIVAFEYDVRVDAERKIFETAKRTIEQSGAKLQLATLQDLLAYGTNITEEPLPLHPKGLEGTGALIHSSSSTGTPKGLIIPDRVLNFGWLAQRSPAC